MIIRSQDKKSITNFNNIDTLCIEQNYCGCNVVCFNGAEESRSKIGEYSTEKKAIKVLDMIEKEYGRHYYGEGGPLATMNHYVEPFAFIPPKVFQMPQDSEV